MTAMDSEQKVDATDEQATEPQAPQGQAAEMEIPQGHAEETAVEEKKKTAKPPKHRSKGQALAELSEKQVKDLRKWELLELAAAEGLETAGAKKALAKRLISKKRGGDKGYRHGHTLCKVCKAEVEVKSTRREGAFIIRQVRCKGKNIHRYPITERVETAEK